MAASVNDKITDTRNAARPVTTTVSSGRSSGGTTLSCASLTGWPTASKVHFVTYQIDTNSDPVAGTQTDCRGIVSGSDITSFSVIDGTDTGNSIGDVVEMLPTAAWGQDLADALSTSHDRDGSLKDGAVDSAGVLASDVVTTAKILDSNVTNAKLAGSITYAKLLSTIFSGEVTSAVNAGTASGTNNYVNLGGIKLLWGKSSSQAVGTGGSNLTITLPVGFFSTITYASFNPHIVGVTTIQKSVGITVNTTTVTYNVWADTNGSTQTTSWLIIGT